MDNRSPQWQLLHTKTASLPEYWHAQVLSVPQDERDPLVVVGKADVAGEVDAGASEARDLRRVAAWNREKAELIYNDN